MQDIILKTIDGTQNTYQNVDKIAIPTPDGSTAIFTEGQAVSKTVEPNFASGIDMTVPITDGELVTKLVVKKPDTLVPENISKGVTVAGVTGTAEGGTAGGGGGKTVPWPFDEPDDDATRIYFVGKRFVLNKIGTNMKTIDWGDGNADSGSEETYVHDYGNAGTYCITIDGEITLWKSSASNGGMWCYLQTDPKIIYDDYLCKNILHISIGRNATLSGSAFYGLYGLRGIRFRGKEWELSGTILARSGNSSSPILIDALDAPSITLSLDGDNHIGWIYARNLPYLSGLHSTTSIFVKNREIKVNKYSLGYGRFFSLAGERLKVTCDETSSGTWSNTYVQGDLLLPNIAKLPSMNYVCCDRLILGEVTSIGSAENFIGNFEIPPTVQTIGNNFLTYASIGTLSVTIPDACTSIGSMFCFGNYIVQEINIGKGITTLPSRFGESCPCLKSITIPANITTIGELVLQTCQNLIEAHILATTPPTCSGSAGTSASYAPFAGSGFGYNNYGKFGTKIYVPKGCADAYKTAAGWKYMAALIQEEPDEKT